MKQWAAVSNISGMEIYIVFSEHFVLEITSEQPQSFGPGELPEKFAYIADYLKDHTKRPAIPEALKDFDLSWATPFQKSVYKALASVPSGTVVSYGELAELAGHPGAARAVGSVMNKNRFMIALPCHRVIAAGGKIGGFASGLTNKRLLLKPEGLNDL